MALWVKAPAKQAGQAESLEPEQRWEERIQLTRLSLHLYRYMHTPPQTLLYPHTHKYNFKIKLFLYQKVETVS